MVFVFVSSRPNAWRFSLVLSVIIWLSLFVQSSWAFGNLHPAAPGPAAASSRSLHGVFFAQKERGRSQHKDDGSVYSSYLATCIPGLSTVLAEELKQLGCRNVQLTGQSAVTFSADTRQALSTILWTRTSHKIMEFLCSSDTEEAGGVENRQDLYNFIQQSVPVKSLLGDGRGGLLTLSVSTILNNPSKIPKDINHSHFSALTVKNALCDAVRDLRGDRPDVDLQDPDVPLTVILRGTEQAGGAQVSLYRQLHAAGSLHKRGYRTGTAIHKAAMKESMAAGLLLHAGWDKKCQRAAASHEAPATILVDPMCGSGSLLIEGAMIAADLAPGLMRIKCGQAEHNLPPAVRWKYEEEGNNNENVVNVWKELLLDATQRAKQGLRRMRSSDGSSSNIQIIGNDIHPGALDLLENSLERSGLKSVVAVNKVGDCSAWQPSTVARQQDWVVVSHPPWGIRLTEDMHRSWEALRVFLRERCPANTEAWVLSGNPAATKHLGLRKSRSVPLKTGQQDLRWIQYIIRDKHVPNDSDGKPIGWREDKAVPPKRKSALARDPRRQEARRKDSIENEWMI